MSCNVNKFWQASEIASSSSVCCGSKANLRSKKQTPRTPGLTYHQRWIKTVHKCSKSKKVKPLMFWNKLRKKHSTYLKNIQYVIWLRNKKHSTSIDQCNSFTWSLFLRTSVRLMPGLLGKPPASATHWPIPRSTGHARQLWT